METFTTKDGVTVSDRWLEQVRHAIRSQRAEAEALERARQSVRNPPNVFELERTIAQLRRQLANK